MQGGALGAHAPPPTWEKKCLLRNVQKRRESSAQISRAKKNVHVARSDTHKIKYEKRAREKKKKNSEKGKG